LVSDHGSSLGHLEELILDKRFKDLEFYFPLLMVKDFDSHGFTVSDEFMTNADVPTLAVAGLIENPVNPFTGKIINNDEKYAHDQIIIRSSDWKVDLYLDRTMYLPSSWASVHDSFWDSANWKFCNEQQILTEHALP
jgi:hypothetical protein